MQVGYARVSTSENIDEKYQLKRTENYKGSNEFISTYLEGGFSFEPLTKEEIKILNLE